MGGLDNRVRKHEIDAAAGAIGARDANARANVISQQKFPYGPRVGPENGQARALRDERDSIHKTRALDEGLVCA